MALLEIRDLRVNYGPIQAIRGIDLDIEEGSIVALLGANGAGKTTTLRTISGVIKPASGTIKLNGQELSSHTASKIAKMGVNMSPEGRLILNGLTVEENLRVGAYCIRSKARVEENMRYVLKLFPQLADRLKQQASTLSGGEQQMLAIARALMANPGRTEPRTCASGNKGYFQDTAGYPCRRNDYTHRRAECACNAEDSRHGLRSGARKNKYAGPGKRSHTRRASYRGVSRQQKGLNTKVIIAKAMI